MTTQLRLIDGRGYLRGHPGPGARPWRLDPRTRAIGRRGVARARLELEKARPNIPEKLRRAG
jgi:hypothetical protein